MEINFGRSYYSDELQKCDVSESEFVGECITKFSKNYWGVADKEQWKSNNIAFTSGEGEIKAKYQREEDGLVIYVINFSVKEYRYTVYCTQKELDDGYYSKIIDNLSKPSKRIRWA